MPSHDETVRLQVSPPVPSFVIPFLFLFVFFGFFVYILLLSSRVVDSCDVNILLFATPLFF